MTEAIAPPTAISQVRPMRLLSDDRLMRLATAGDQRAFTTIYQRYHQELYRYCLAILRRPEDASDALQSTMLNALRSLPGEERRISLRPWLYRVAHNEAITILRQRSDPAPLEQAMEPESPSPGQQVEEKTRLRELVADLRMLGDRQRGALLMRELSGLSYTEIGSVFGTSSSAAKQTLYEARVALQEIAGGREMDCEPVRKALSANDGRMLRGRKLRSHLRHCPGCRDFRAAIGQRRSDLAILAPPLPAAAAAGLLHSLAGGGASTTSGGAAAGLLAGAGAKTFAVSGGLKIAAAVVAAATIGVATAEVTGVAPSPFAGRTVDGKVASPTPPAVSSGSPGRAGAATHHQDAAGDAGSGGAGQSAEKAGSSSAVSHGSSTGAHGSAGTHENGRSRGVQSGRSFGQGTAQSHAPQLPSQAQSHPAPVTHPAPAAAKPPAASAGPPPAPGPVAQPSQAPNPSGKGASAGSP